jgi:ribosomal protein S18 acetylase RimI-like enzyme
LIDLDFRNATVADIPALHDLIERAYSGETARKGWTHEADLLGGQRTDALALAALVDDPRQRMIIAESAGALVGCVQVAHAEEGKAYLGHLSVEPDRQAAGIGRQLVAAAESAAIHDFAAREMEMTVIRQRSELINWYCRLGYVDTGLQRPFPITDRRFGEPKIADLAFVVLRKTINMELCGAGF